MEETDLALNAIGVGDDHEAAEHSEVDDGIAGEVGADSELDLFD
jgi:hypothetical protein